MPACFVGFGFTILCVRIWQDVQLLRELEHELSEVSRRAAETAAQVVKETAANRLFFEARFVSEDRTYRWELQEDGVTYVPMAADLTEEEKLELSAGVRHRQESNKQLAQCLIDLHGLCVSIRGDVVAASARRRKMRETASETPDAAKGCSSGSV